LHEPHKKVRAKYICPRCLRRTSQQNERNYDQTDTFPAHGHAVCPDLVHDRAQRAASGYHHRARNDNRRSPDHVNHADNDDKVERQLLKPIYQKQTNHEKTDHHRLLNLPWNSGADFVHHRGNSASDDHEHNDDAGSHDRGNSGNFNANHYHAQQRALLSAQLFVL
jgi:hypothetical protein